MPMRISDTDPDPRPDFLRVKSKKLHVLKKKTFLQIWKKLKPFFKKLVLFPSKKL